MTDAAQQLVRARKPQAATKQAAMLRQILILLMAWILVAGNSPAQDMVTEAVPAGFRDAGELAAILRPLIPPPGSVGAFHNQLVIRTTPENLAELRELLVSLDKAPANLLISVRRTLDAEISRDLAQARLELRGDSGRVSIGAPSRRRTGTGISASRGDVDADVRLQRRTVSKQDDSTQRVRVLEGAEAFIQTGESVPVGDRQVIITGAGVAVNEGTRYEEFGAGFWARARLSGERVTLDVYPDQRQLRGDGNAAVQRTSTSVSGVLGRWMEIGSANIQSERGNSAIGSSRNISTRRQNSTFVKVDRLD